jgi:hypothetical protein
MGYPGAGEQRLVKCCSRPRLLWGGSGRRAGRPLHSVPYIDDAGPKVMRRRRRRWRAGARFDCSGDYGGDIGRRHWDNVPSLLFQRQRGQPADQRCRKRGADPIGIAWIRFIYQTDQARIGFPLAHVFFGVWILTRDLTWYPCKSRMDRHNRRPQVPPNRTSAVPFLPLKCHITLL